jgi:hypothetical protein
MKPGQKPVVFVTGDVVLDCHLYGGAKSAATSFSELGTTYAVHSGGAALTYRLLKAAADSRGRSRDADKGRRRPRPAPVFDVRCAFKDTGLERALPRHLHSYGVWTDHPVRKGAKERVWRADRHFGYGSTGRGSLEKVFKPSAQGEAPTLTVIDDGGILFRHGSSRRLWPDLSANPEGHYLLKMSSPLCRGDLWAELKPVMDRLMVVVSVADLRREDTRISQRLSWEECVENTLRALSSDPTAGDLLRAAHLVLNFGSVGAIWVQGGSRDQRSIRLLFNPVRLEGDGERDVEGTVYGFQTCMAVGLAYHVMNRHAETVGGTEGGKSPLTDSEAMRAAIEQGIAAGLTIRRRLLELGHGPVGTATPGFPVDVLAQDVARSPGGFVSVAIPADGVRPTRGQWTILAQAELGGETRAPLIGLAQLTARYGVRALSHVPALCFDPLFTVDRSEIESLRTLDTLIRAYEGTKVQKKPLSIGVFGPPGAGKSFGVKALTRAILGDKVPFLEFNLSQFKGPEELIGAFHRVRDAVLMGPTPVAFWDEFDSQGYKWLQYLLAPMHDGAFQEGQIIHPIGKCVFIFAGGTSHTLESFGVTPPSRARPDAEPPAGEGEDRARGEPVGMGYQEFKLLKGPDFISRLDGFLNVLGLNERKGTASPDITWPIRRAIVLRGTLRLGETEELSIDAGLLHALLSVPTYRHGARSFEKIVTALAHGRDGGRLQRAALPPEPLLDRETEAVEFLRLMEAWNPFKAHLNMEQLAAAVHEKFLDGAARSQLDAERASSPHRAWTIHPAVQKVYDDLEPDMKASNRAAALRVPEHLALINFVVLPATQEDPPWKDALVRAIDRHVDRLAQAEHLGWWAERVANGWTYAPERDNARKRHPLLIEWSRLSPADQDKDRSGARSIPDLLEVAGFKAEPVAGAPRPGPREASPPAGPGKEEHSVRQ